MIIRKYESKDCNRMAELFYNTVHTVNAKDYTKEQLKAWAPENINLNSWDKVFLEHITLIAEENGEIVGFADMDKSGYIDRLYVHKNYQGQGIATTLISDLEGFGKERGVYSFETYASITARPFFEKMGYSVARENIVIKAGIPLKNYRMVKHMAKAK